MDEAARWRLIVQPSRPLRRQAARSRQGQPGCERHRAKDSCRYCGVIGHWMRDCRKKKREEGEDHLVRGGGDNDDALLMMQACTVASAPQLPASTQAESDTSEAAPSSRSVAESRT